MKYGDTIDLNNDLIRRALALKGIKASEGELAIFGIRGAIPVDGNTIMVTLNSPNEANDTIGVFGTEFHCYRGSCDPGRTHVLNPSNPNGCAFLELGRWRYRLGTHRKKHLALVQDGVVRVRRDKNRNYRPEPFEPVDTGLFGINIHAMGFGEHVDEWSAGCQVIMGGWTGAPWLSFLEKCEAAHRKGQVYFWHHGPLNVDTVAEAYRQREAGLRQMI